MVANSAQIDFTLTCEFNTAGLFTYTPRTNAKKLSEQINFEIDYRNQGIIVPMYTFNKLFMENDDDGWRYFTSRMYRVDESGTTDTMDLEPIFRDTNIKDLIAYHKQQGMDNHVFFNMRVYMVDKELTEGTDWKFDLYIGGVHQGTFDETKEQQLKEAFESNGIDYLKPNQG
jgi:hypothetical protein